MKRLAVLTAMMLTLLTFTGAAFAQDQTSDKCSNDKVWNCQAIENLKTGISSDNEGLRRSSIYFAGQYKLAELTPALVKQLKREENRSTRILIALSLYKIGSKEGTKAISRLADNDQDLKVRRICTAIYDDIKTGSYKKELAMITRR